MNSEVSPILRQIHGLLHEALANVEIPIAEGRRMIEQVEDAETTEKDDATTESELEELIESLQESIKEPIAKEVENNNPFAAVMEIRELLTQLSGTDDGSQ